MDDSEPASAGSKFVPLGLSLGSGRSVVLGADSVEQNVDESALDLAGTGTAVSRLFQDWGSGEVGIGILQML